MGQSLCKILPSSFSNPNCYLCCRDEETGVYGVNPCNNMWPWASCLTTLGLQDGIDLDVLWGLWCSCDCSPQSLGHISSFKALGNPQSGKLLSLELQVSKDQVPWKSWFGILDTSRIHPPNSTFPHWASVCVCVYGGWWPKVKLWTGRRLLGTFLAHPGSGGSRCPLRSTDCLPGTTCHSPELPEPCSKPSLSQMRRQVQRAQAAHPKSSSSRVRVRIGIRACLPPKPMPVTTTLNCLSGLFLPLSPDSESPLHPAGLPPNLLLVPRGKVW